MSTSRTCSTSSISRISGTSGTTSSRSVVLVVLVLSVVLVVVYWSNSSRRVRSPSVLVVLVVRAVQQFLAVVSCRSSSVQRDFLEAQTRKGFCLSLRGDACSKPFCCIRTLRAFLNTFRPPRLTDGKVKASDVPFSSLKMTKRPFMRAVKG